MRRRRGEVPSRSSSHVRSDFLPPPQLPRPPIYRYVQVFPPTVDLRPHEDRRRYHPLKALAPAGVVGRREARSLRERPRNTLEQFPALRLGFHVPERVVKCVRRQRRKEVIFALNKQGKGARSTKRRRDSFSDISCKR